jgi:hypothetical protein
MAGWAELSSPEGGKIKFPLSSMSTILKVAAGSLTGVEVKHHTNFFILCSAHEYFFRRRPRLSLVLLSDSWILQLLHQLSSSLLLQLLVSRCLASNG